MQMIREGDYRMMHLLERAGYRTLELGKHSRALENINSTVDYRTLETGPRPFVFAVSGWKNSGKNHDDHPACAGAGEARIQGGSY